tara:strand:- start:423 stop:1514 length:1092 start_codon:yes stop_codon:yes gene_type:complete
MNDHFIERAFSLAEEGVGKVSPRPSVGAVIIKDNRIISEGRTDPQPGNHAEVNAINACNEDLDNSVLICTLEPHSYHGITPPCTEAIIKSGIKKVICPIEDPNPKVSGNGFRQLQYAGIEIERNFSKINISRAKKIIEGFEKSLFHKIPFISIKIASSLDGKTSTNSNQSKWITSEESRKYGRLLRTKYDAVMTGINTIESDNPQLTFRDNNGNNTGYPRYKIVLDSNGKINEKAKIFDSNEKTIIFTTKKNNINFQKNNLQIFEVEKVDGRTNLDQVMRIINNLGIHKILVESGNILSTELMKKNFIDKVYYFIAPKIIGGEKMSVGDLGVKTIQDIIKLQDIEYKNLDEDILISGYLKEKE